MNENDLLANLKGQTPQAPETPTKVAFAMGVIEGPAFQMIPQVCAQMASQGLKIIGVVNIKLQKQVALANVAGQIQSEDGYAVIGMKEME